jgi:hypothetical protein
LYKINNLYNMKTKILIITFFVIFVGIKTNYAENDSVAFKHSIVNKIVYPDFAMKDKLTADVWVKFTVSETGKIVVDQINSVDVLFLDYVKTEIQKLEIDAESELIGRTYYYKFSFKFQPE